MDGVSLAGRDPDRCGFLIGTSGLPRSGSEAGDRLTGGGFPWREMSGYLMGERPVL